MNHLLVHINQDTRMEIKKGKESTVHTRAKEIKLLNPDGPDNKASGPNPLIYRNANYIIVNKLSLKDNQFYMPLIYLPNLVPQSVGQGEWLIWSLGSTFDVQQTVQHRG